MSNPHDEVWAAVTLQNNTPVDDFCGLTPAEMHPLLYNPFGVNSPMHLRPDIADATLDRIPFFRLVEEFLRIIAREGALKLTPRGALPRRVLHELYAHRFIPESFIDSGIVNLRREEEFTALLTAHHTVEGGPLLRKVKGRLTLTKLGREMLRPENRRELFRLILAAYTLGFAWSSNDGYTESPVGQFGWGYTIFLLSKFGAEERPLSFYSESYLRAFPKAIIPFDPSPFGSPQESFTACFAVRVFTRFLGWFGMASFVIPEWGRLNPSAKVRATNILGEVFHFP